MAGFILPYCSHVRPVAAPLTSVLTHGFVLDEHGRKMSLGNVVTPQAVMEQNGAGILRLWVVSSDYYNDLRMARKLSNA